MLDQLNLLWHRLGDFAAGKLLPAALLAAIGIFLARLVLRLLKEMLERTHLEAPATKLIRQLAKTVVYVLLTLMVASALGIDVTGVVALASVLTLAVSLSVQDALTNMIGGFTLLYTRPFSVGDFVQIGSQSGTIREVGLTYTRITTPDNKTVSIPNKNVVSTEIVNFSATGTRRIELQVTASYDAPSREVIESLLEAAQLPLVLEDPAPFAGLNSYGDSAISYVLRFWCASGDYQAALFGVNENIKTVFDRRGIVMTYPHLNVHLDK